MAEAGAQVVIFSRNRERLEAAAEKIKARRLDETGRVEYRVLDATVESAVQDVLSRTVAELGAPDIFINIAGRAIPQYFEKIDSGMFDETLRTNLYAVRNTCAAIIPLMKEKGGLVVNTSSLVGFMGIFGYTDYAASKFAVIGFSEALRSEMKPQGIQVQVLCPPDTDTPGFETENKTKPAETRVISESAGLMTPEAVALDFLKGMCGNKFMIIPGLEGKFTFWAKRYIPRVVEWVIDGQVRKARRSKV